MEDKYEKYYGLVDIYNPFYEMPNSDEDTSDKDEVLREFFPISFGLVNHDVEPIINEICKKFQSKEKVEKEIENLRNTPENSIINNMKKCGCRNISLIDLLNADYNYLKNNFYIRHIEFVPNENYFINNYSFPMDPDFKYDFSLKELFDILLMRLIHILINNYFNKIK